jgi:superfamily II DNA or RNA helicase
MKKAVLSNRIYLSCTTEYREFLNDTLTYVIPAYNPIDPPQVIKNMARIREDLVSIPIGRTDLIPKDYEIIDKRRHVPVDLPEFKGTLRASQQAVYDSVDGNAIINAWVSWGKTFTALSIAKKLGQKTLVVLHTIPLRNQWAREIQKVFGFTPGIIGSGKFNDTTPIVVGNVQTLYNNIPQIKKSFGTIILDEMHHVSAPTFSRIIDTSYARYKIGLSGTLERKDGKHVVFRDYFGNNVLKPPKENYLVPSIDIVRSGIRFMDGQNTPWAHKVTALTTNSEYIHLISMLAAAYAAKGHRVLVVSDRVAFLKKCAELVGDKALYITGDVPHEEREELLNKISTGEKEILFGTKAIFSEGISESTLSCLILGTPINNEPLLTQLIGRVIRDLPGKLQPKIVDVHLEGNTARRQASNRMGHYIKQGYNIREL